MDHSVVTDGGRSRANSTFYQDLQKKYPAALSKTYTSASPHQATAKIINNKSEASSQTEKPSQKYMDLLNSEPYKSVYQKYPHAFNHLRHRGPPHKSRRIFDSGLRVHLQADAMFSDDRSICSEMPLSAWDKEVADIMASNYRMHKERDCLTSPTPSLCSNFSTLSLKERLNLNKQTLNDLLSKEIPFRRLEPNGEARYLSKSMMSLSHRNSKHKICNGDEDFERFREYADYQIDHLQRKIMSQQEKLQTFQKILSLSNVDKRLNPQSESLRPDSTSVYPESLPDSAIDVESGSVQSVLSDLPGVLELDGYDLTAKQDWTNIRPQHRKTETETSVYSSPFNHLDRLTKYESVHQRKLRTYQQKVASRHGSANQIQGNGGQHSSETSKHGHMNGSADQYRAETVVASMHMPMRDKLYSSGSNNSSLNQDMQLTGSYLESIERYSGNRSPAAVVQEGVGKDSSSIDSNSVNSSHQAPERENNSVHLDLQSVTGMPRSNRVSFEDEKDDTDPRFGIEDVNSTEEKYSARLGNCKRSPSPYVIMKTVVSPRTPVPPISPQTSVSEFSITKNKIEKERKCSAVSAEDVFTKTDTPKQSISQLVNGNLPDVHHSNLPVVKNRRNSSDRAIQLPLIKAQFQATSPICKSQTLPRANKKSTLPPSQWDYTCASQDLVHQIQSKTLSDPHIGVHQILLPQTSVSNTTENELNMNQPFKTSGTIHELKLDESSEKAGTVHLLRMNKPSETSGTAHELELNKPKGTSSTVENHMKNSKLLDTSVTTHELEWNKPSQASSTADQLEFNEALEMAGTAQQLNLNSPSTPKDTAYQFGESNMSLLNGDGYDASSSLVTVVDNISKHASRALVTHSASPKLKEVPTNHEQNINTPHHQLDLSSNEEEKHQVKQTSMYATPISDKCDREYENVDFNQDLIHSSQYQANVLSNNLNCSIISEEDKIYQEEDQCENIFIPEPSSIPIGDDDYECEIQETMMAQTGTLGNLVATEFTPSKNVKQFHKSTNPNSTKSSESSAAAEKRKQFKISTAAHQVYTSPSLSTKSSGSSTPSIVTTISTDTPSSSPIKKFPLFNTRKYAGKSTGSEKKFKIRRIFKKKKGSYSPALESENFQMEQEEMKRHASMPNLSKGNETSPAEDCSVISSHKTHELPLRRPKSLEALTVLNTESNLNHKRKLDNSMHTFTKMEGFSLKRTKSVEDLSHDLPKSAAVVLQNEKYISKTCSQVYVNQVPGTSLDDIQSELDINIPEELESSNQPKIHHSDPECESLESNLDEELIACGDINVKHFNNIVPEQQQDIGSDESDSELDINNPFDINVNLSSSVTPHRNEVDKLVVKHESTGDETALQIREQQFKTSDEEQEVHAHNDNSDADLKKLNNFNMNVNEGSAPSIALDKYECGASGDDRNESRNIEEVQFLNHAKKQIDSGTSLREQVYYLDGHESESEGSDSEIDENSPFDIKINMGSIASVRSYRFEASRHTKPLPTNDEEELVLNVSEKQLDSENNHRKVISPDYNKLLDNSLPLETQNWINL
ncbi:hypothetical protein ScPMuIL_010234 [Solemya velum]